MSEDELGRQLSELIEASADVELPPGLAASVADIPHQGPRRRANRRLLTTTGAICAVVALVAAALVGPWVLSNPPVAASPSGSLPATQVRVLTAEELRAAIAAQRAGGLEPWDVVVDVAIDTSRKSAPLSRTCDPSGECQVIGTLQGFGDGDGTVAIRQQLSVLPPATDAASVQPPVALRLTGRGPIEFLGHVRFAPSGSPTWSVAEVVADTATAPDEQVVGVDGWLAGEAQISCGPAPEPGVPNPFVCGVHDYITPDPRYLVTAEGDGSYFLSPPGDGIAVQGGAYRGYAPNLFYRSDLNAEPRRSIYLLRMVAYQGPGCTNCRGWLLVGRLDASSSPLPIETDTVETPTPHASPAAGEPQPGYLPGSAHLSGSSGWMELPSGLKWSDDAGRTWTDVAYPVGVSYDQVIALAAAPDRPMWLAVRSGDGYRLHRKLDVAAAWSSVLLTPPAALLRSGGNVVWLQLIPGPGRMVTVQVMMADGSAVFFVSSDDGASFVQRGSPAADQTDMAWAWSTFTTPDYGVAIELTGQVESAHPFLHTSDAGTTWSDARVTGLPAMNSYRLGRPRLVGSDIEVPIDTGTGSTSRFFLLVSHDGGASFNPLGVPVLYKPTTTPTWGLHTWYPAFDTLGSVTWWAADGGIIEETADGGETWTAVKAEGLPRGFHSIDELDLTGPTSAMAVVSAQGTTGNVSWTEEYLLATTDGGRTWTIATSIPTGPSETAVPWPTDIAGEGVLAPADVSKRVAQGPGSFLVGGFVHLNMTNCISTEWLAPACGYFFLTPRANQLEPGLKLASPESDVQVRRQLADLLGHAVVVRVHAHDPRASECLPAHRATCDAAVVIDSVVWADSPVSSPS